MILFVLPYHMRTICLYINIQYIGGRHTQQNINFQFDFILRVRARTTYTTIYSRRRNHTYEKPIHETESVFLVWMN